MRFIVLFLSLLIATPAWAAMSRVQSAISLGECGESSRQVSLENATQVNNLVVAVCSGWLVNGQGNTNPATFTDNQINSWSVPVVIGYDDDFGRTAMYMAWAISGSASTETLTCTAPVGNMCISLVLVEYTGNVTISPLDQTQSNLGTGVSVSTGTTGTTAQADEMLVAGLAGGGAGSRTPTSPLVEVEANGVVDPWQPIGVGDRVLSSVGMYSGEWTLEESDQLWGAGVMTFKASGVPAGARRIWGVVP